MGKLSSEIDVSASPPADPALISEECLSAAEQVLNCVHPTLDSEEKRRDVIDYVQQLVKSQLNCEVIDFGLFSLSPLEIELDFFFTFFFKLNYFLNVHVGGSV